MHAYTFMHTIIQHSYTPSKLDAGPPRRSKGLSLIWNSRTRAHSLLPLFSLSSLSLTNGALNLGYGRVGAKPTNDWKKKKRMLAKLFYYKLLLNHDFVLLLPLLREEWEKEGEMRNEFDSIWPFWRITLAVAAAVTAVCSSKAITMTTTTKLSYKALLCCHLLLL